MSEPDDGESGNAAESGSAAEEEANPLQRVLDILVFAPVGIALTVAEDLPGLVGKGHQRFETDVQNARIVGRIVVGQAQRQLLERVGKLLHLTSSPGTEDASDSTAPADGEESASGASTGPSARSAPSPKPAADPADEAIVERALAGYDTLSASQVVRRLESLGPDELRALQRYEASHRNRHTILNRAHQILETIEATGGAVPPAPSASAPAFGAVDAPGAPETGAPETVAPETGAPETVAPETVAPDNAPTTSAPGPPPVPGITPPEPDRPGE